MKNKRFIVLLIALLALIALIFTVGFLAGKRNKPMDHSISLPTQASQTDEPNDDPVTVMPDNSDDPDKTIDPLETGCNESSRCQNDSETHVRSALTCLWASFHADDPRNEHTRVHRG